jgi:truncated hemoglobin YjbI
MPFRIGTAERDHWLAHMAAAVQAVSPDDEVTAMLMGYFVPVADQLRNDTGLPIGSSPRR